MFFVNYFVVLGLCCYCGGPLTNWNSMDTETQTYNSLVFEGMHLLGLVNDTPISCFREIFRGPRTMLRLRRAAYKLELYGHRDSNLVRFFEGMGSLGLVEVLDTPNSCFRIFSLKIFRGSRTHVFVKYFAVLGLCCACGGPLTNWNSVDTGTQT